MPQRLLRPHCPASQIASQHANAPAGQLTTQSPGYRIRLASSLALPCLYPYLPCRVHSMQHGCRTSMPAGCSCSEPRSFSMLDCDRQFGSATPPPRVFSNVPYVSVVALPVSLAIAMIENSEPAGDNPSGPGGAAFKALPCHCLCLDFKFRMHVPPPPAFALPCVRPSYPWNPAACSALRAHGTGWVHCG